MPPFKIQLAIQGGGAKIVGLLAAMEVVEALEAKGEFKVTRLAGTSAGAIVACLYAAGVRMSDLRVSLSEGLISQLLARYQTLTLSGALKELVQGNPVCDPAPIRDFLRDQFEKHNKKFLHDFDRPVFVVSSNLAASTKHLHPKSDSILDALMSSSAIPFVFRTWTGRTTRVGGVLRRLFDGLLSGPDQEQIEREKEDREEPFLVDGGVCENLPIDELTRGREVDQFGPVVAITFGKSNYTRPRSVFAFARSLLDTAIDNSVHRARTRIPPSSVFEIGNWFPISTLDFREAVHVAHEHANPNGPYSRIRSAAHSFFLNYLERRTQGNPDTNYDPWASESAVVDNVMFAGWAMCECLSKARFSYESVSMVAVIHKDRPDESHIVTTFRVNDEPIHCLKVSLMNAVGREYLGRTYWSVIGPNGKDITPIAVPVKNPKSAHDRWVALYFNPALPPESGPYTLSLSDYVDSVLDNLEKEGRDEWGFETSRAVGNSKSLELVVVHPNSLRIKASAQNSMECANVRDLRADECREHLKRVTLDQYLACGVIAVDVVGAQGGIDVTIL